MSSQRGPSPAASSSLSSSTEDLKTAKSEYHGLSGQWSQWEAILLDDEITDIKDEL